MAPPPGRRRSGKQKMYTSISDSIKSIDANPSETLTSQIASSILQERYGVKGKGAAPPKVQEAVRRCLQDVSKTIQTEHPQWDLPRYGEKNLKPMMAPGSSSQGRRHGRERDVVRSADEEDDPFLYDRNDDKTTTGFHSEKSEDHAKMFSCPFRKRDPVLFNIRDHEGCARESFRSMLELKYDAFTTTVTALMNDRWLTCCRRHIRVYHRISRDPHHCPRCKMGFGTPNALSDHLTVPLEAMCEPRLAAPEPVTGYGISEEVDRILADNKSMIHIQNWEDLWRLLFPQDVSVLDPGQSETIPAFG